MKSKSIHLASTVCVMFVLFLFFLPTKTFAANLYVRSGATGANNGTSWSNAYTATPSMTAINRGDTLYYAAGSYGQPTLSKAASGSDVITLKKATIADHGGGSGWNDSYATGAAVFDKIIIATDYWVIDGATGGGPGQWTSGFGFELSVNSGFNWDYVSIPDDGVGRSHLTFRHLKIASVGTNLTAARQNAFFFPGSIADHDYMLWEYIYIDNISGASWFLRRGNHNVIQYFYDGNDCGIYPDHTEHCESIIMHQENDFQIRWGVFRNAISSGSIVKNEGESPTPAAPSTGVYVYGVLFFGYGGGGLLVCNSLSTCPQWYFFNNTYVMKSQPGSVMLEKGTGTSYSISHNNIFSGTGAYGMYRMITNPGLPHDANYYVDLAGGPLNSGNLGQTIISTTLEFYPIAENGCTGCRSDSGDIMTNTHAGASNPFINDQMYTSEAPEDYKLSGHIPGSFFSYNDAGVIKHVPISSAGIDICQYLIDHSYPQLCDTYHPFNKDMFSNTRGADGTWDRGAIQYVSGSTITPPPPPAPLPGDLNLDHIVNSLDWSIMQSVWLTSNSTADINHDSVVNSLDFSVLSSSWLMTW